MLTYHSDPLSNPVWPVCAAKLYILRETHRACRKKYEKNTAIRLYEGIKSFEKDIKATSAARLLLMTAK